MPTLPYCDNTELDEEAESQQCKHCRYPVLHCECEEKEPLGMDPASRSQQCLEHGKWWHQCLECQNRLDQWKENQNKRQKIGEEKVEEEKVEEAVKVCSRCLWVPLFCKCPFPRQLIVQEQQEELKQVGVKSCSRCQKHPLYCTCPFPPQPVEGKEKGRSGGQVKGECKLCAKVVTDQQQRFVPGKLLKKNIQRYFHVSCLCRLQEGGENPVVEELEPICPFCDEMVVNTQKRIVGEHATCHEACVKGLAPMKSA